MTFRRYGRSLSAGAVLFLCASVGGRAQEPDTWKLYDFSDTRLVELELSVTENGGTQNGSVILEFEPRGDDRVTLRFRGEMGENSSEFSTTAAEDEIYGRAMVQMMMTPVGAPLMVTIFAPFWGIYFIGQDMEIGSGWSFSDSSKAVSFKVESVCSAAGIEGKKIVWREDDEIRAQACVNRGLPLPLELDFRAEDGERYHVVMKRYESRS